MNVANIKRLYPYVLPYKRFAFLNVFFNILYALFSSLSFVALIPMLEVLFDSNARIYEKPVYKGIAQANIYFKEYLNYQVTQQAGGGGSGGESRPHVLRLIIGGGGRGPPPGTQGARGTSEETGTIRGGVLGLSGAGAGSVASAVAGTGGGCGGVDAARLVVGRLEVVAWSGHWAPWGLRDATSWTRVRRSIVEEVVGV